MSDALAARRDALLGQLRYLALEAETLAELLPGLPEAVLTTPLPHERSVLQAFAHLTALDRTVYPERLRRLVAGERPSFDAADPDGDPHGDAVATLDALREAREALVAAFEALAPDDWRAEGTFPPEPGAEPQPGSVYDFALAITQHDVAVLRLLTERLYHAHLTDRAEDLPK